MGSGLAGWLEKVYPDDRSAFEAEIARVIETHDSFRLVYRFRRKDGGVIWVEDRGHFFRDAQGVVSRMVGFIEDVTERTRSDQALRSSEERFSLVFRSSPQAIQITRQRDARILEVNDTWEAVFGYGREEAIGRTAADLGMFIVAGRPGTDARAARRRGVPSGTTSWSCGPAREKSARSPSTPSGWTWAGSLVT